MNRRQHWIHSMASQVRRESLVDALAMVRALEREEREHGARNSRFVRVNQMMGCVVGEQIELYRPSNGTEGDCFISANCFKCERSKIDHDDIEAGFDCDILHRSMAYTEADDEYPREWQDHPVKGPLCTAFIAKGEPIPEASKRDDRTIDMFAEQEPSK